MGPTLILGGASIGTTIFNTNDEVKALLNASSSCGIRHVETAARYPPTQYGRSEELIGPALPRNEEFVIDTKILMTNEKAGSLTSAAISRSIEISHKRLQHEVGEHHCSMLRLLMEIDRRPVFPREGPSHAVR